MTFGKLLIANRGEIAIRIARAASELGLVSVAVHSEDDARSLHLRMADEVVALKGSGAAAYLDMDGIIAAAKETGCDAIHPGYGFLSENAAFAAKCAEAGLAFVGPRPEVLDRFGDKAKARALAAECGVPLLDGTSGATSLEEARDWFKALIEREGDGAALMLKAVAGGGGRGMRPVRKLDELDDAYARCQSEAKAAFGIGDVYLERFIPHARHIEVQILGDGEEVTHLWERECTIQRRHQKLMEIAPSPSLSSGMREQLIEDALTLAREIGYDNIGTFEFLVDADSEESYAFIEANARLQVEHTVTEEVTGVDLVETQLRLAQGATLDGLGLDVGEVPLPRGNAIQLRVNMETMDASGAAKPAGGTLSAFEPPSGPGVRVDTFGYTGYTTNPNFDSLLAKLVVHHASPDYAEAVARTRRALAEFRIEGCPTNIGFLQNLIADKDVAANRVYTRLIDERAAELTAEGTEAQAKRYFTDGASAVAAKREKVEGPAGTVPVGAPMQGKVVSIDVKPGDEVPAGTQLAVLEAMKMEHLVHAAESGIVRELGAEPGQVLFEGDPLIFIEPASIDATAQGEDAAVDPDFIRPDLAEVIERHAIGLDERRPDAVERRRKRNQRTARENIDDLCDEGSFIEYGSLLLAAQRRRRSMEDLIKMSPADGLITGVGTVNADKFGEEKARVMVLSYDFTVFAGTQGAMNHKKTDRVLKIAEDWKLPIVWFAEGGGGRPGDTDSPGVAGLDTPSFLKFAELSGLVPLVSIVSGRCFAGNAALVGCSDVIIATANSNIGMGGPAMIEGGGLGVYAPEDVGPIDVQTKSGVVDIAVEDEAEAVEAAKKYLAYFQGPLGDWEEEDQRLLRQAIPENRLRVYDIYKVIDLVADKGSVLELRREFGIGIVTALVRIGGKPMGLIANNPKYLAGAIDAPAADKAARFMQLCEAFGLPILSLCDTPGFMVGPDVEADAQVRRVSRMFVTAASMTVPFFTVVLRKGYGLGAQAMAGGSFHAPFFNISWPTGEFGGMGLEGAVRLGYKREMEAIEDLDEREAFFQKMVAKYYENGKAINMASFLEIDEVIDPMETRRWVMRGLASVPPRREAKPKHRPFIDTW